MTAASVFEHPEFDAHEDLTFAHDPATGLRAIIAIHSTRRGPALGGCRIHSYETEAHAITDALRLSQGMTLKAAIAGLPLGGGKAVIWTDADRPKTAEMMQAFGRAVDRLGGRYITAEDVGATVADMDAVSMSTAHVAGVSRGIGDPSPYTARGVFLCLEAAWRHKTGRDLDGAHVAVKGLGNVGFKLCQLLQAAGARLTVADINPEALARAKATLGASVAPVADIHRTEADIFAPCALGADLSAERIADIGARLICGAANNQLATTADDAHLAAAGIAYCPDYLVNAGGLIAVASGKLGYGVEEVSARVEALPQTLIHILESAAGAPTGEIADQIARASLEVTPDPRAVA